MKRILCVDDEPEQCELLELALDRLGYRPTTTTSPAHALELVASTAFDTIVTDLGMSEMDGFRCASGCSAPARTCPSSC